MWCKNVAWEQIVKESWGQGQSEDGLQICDRIQRCGTTLGSWNCKAFGSINKCISEKRKELEEAYIVGQRLGDAERFTFVHERA